MTDTSTSGSLPWLVTVADVAAVALLALALVPAVLHGGVHLHIRGLRLLSLTSSARPLVAAALLILARHVAFRRDNLWLRFARALRLEWDIWPPSARAQRQMCVSGLAILLLVLAGHSSPILTGDGGEYMTMARNLARLRPPALTPEEVLSLDSPFPNDHIDYRSFYANTFEGPHARREFVHFWLYPLLASPFVAIAGVTGISPNYGFLALNLLCLVAAAIVLMPRIGPWATLLITTGPLVWWIDKAHTEIFVFSTLAAALALLPSAPGLAVLVLGALVAQVPALTPVACIVFVWAVARGAARSRGFWLGVVAGVAIASLHPLYYWVRLGSVSPLAQVAARQWPTWTVLTAFLWDPNIGLLTNHPALTLALAGAALTLLVRAPRRLFSADVLLMLFAGGAALLAFSQTKNFNHGATVSMSRYAVWTIPLVVPLFAQLHEAAAPRTSLWLPLLAGVSLIWAIAVYPPARTGDYLTPTPLADWLWRQAPALDNPLPEIFCERVEHSESHTLPAATPGCEKVLLAGTGGRVTWPHSCVSAPVPEECRATNALCYANRASTVYSYAKAPWQPGFDWTTTPGAELRDR